MKYLSTYLILSILIFYNISQSSSSQCKSATAPGIPVSHPQSLVRSNASGCNDLVPLPPGPHLLRWYSLWHPRGRSPPKQDSGWFSGTSKQPQETSQKHQNQQSHNKPYKLTQIRRSYYFLYLLFYKKQSHQVQVIRDESMNPLKYKLNML